MLLTNLKFAVRVFLKDKFFSVLNILGLALGIAVSILLLLMLQNDLTYDQYHVNHKKIYRLGGHLMATGADFHSSRSARELGNIIKEEFPEVQKVVRANPWDYTLVKYENKSGEEKAFFEEDIIRTDSTYFTVFTHEFISGNPATCLKEPNSVVVTESFAKKYFGDEDPIDKFFVIDGEQWKVTALIKDLPKNTHLKFDMAVSGLSSHRDWSLENGQIKSESFWNPDVFIYLQLPEHYDTQNFYSKFTSINDKYFKPFGDQVGGKFTPILEPLTKIHFYSNLDGDEPHGKIIYLYAFTGVGVFIILLACINYMNLSTAKSIRRAGEIAMKKTLGSAKSSLVISFLTESVLLAFISLLLAVAFVFFLLNATSFNQLIEKNLTLDFFSNPLLLFGSIAVTLLIGILSGLYPALYLPSIPTLTALKGSFKNRKSSHLLRKVLITAQFAISIFVVVCTLFMQDQINYVRSHELGFDKDNVLILPIQDSLVRKQINAIRNEFLQNPSIVAATTSYEVMGKNANGGGSVMWAEGEDGMKQQSFTIISAGDDYLKTLGMKLITGRDFLPDTKRKGSREFIVNETASKLMGWTQDPIGKKVKFFHDTEDGQVIGIVKDFNVSSLHNAVEPLLITKAWDDGGFLHLKIKGDLPTTVKYVKEKWKTFDPNHPFEYFFLDQTFNNQYKEDEMQYKLLSGLSYICIFISLLGLLGLSAFTAAQRTKEIGIRKVHGANLPTIIYLLYKDVMVLVIIASIVVVPLSYFGIQFWLDNFAYKVSLNYLLLAWVAVAALVFTFITVAFHSLKTARTNPVESLKYE